MGRDSQKVPGTVRIGGTIVHPEIHKSYIDTKFDIGAYFHACLVHFFSFVILGPFINLYTILSCVTGAPYLCSNFLFSRIFLQFYSQNFLWLVLMFYYYCTFFTTGVVGDYAGVIFAAVLYYLRASVIGVKYACYGEAAWNRVKKQKIPSEEIFGNLTLVKWLNDKQDQILIELFAAELRNDCFSDSSKVLWLDNQKIVSIFNSRIERTISDNIKALRELNSRHSQNYELDQTGDGEFGHRSIFLTLLYSQKKAGLASNPLNVLFMLLAPLIPAFGRWIYAQSFHGQTWYQILSFYLQLLCNLYLASSALAFYVNARGDFTRRLWL